MSVSISGGILRLGSDGGSDLSLCERSWVGPCGARSLKMLEISDDAWSEGPWDAMVSDKAGTTHWDPFGFEFGVSLERKRCIQSCI